MKILYVTYFDSRQVSRYYSGLGYYMRRSLEQAGHTVDLLCPLAYRGKLFFKLLERSSRWLKLRRYSSLREPVVLRHFARQVEEKFRQGSYDVVFGGGPELCELPESVPTVVWADGTFRAVTRMYPDFQNDSRRSVDQGERAERLILRKCRAAIFSNTWGAASALSDYGVSPERVFVVPYGANFDAGLTPAEFESLLSTRGLHSPPQLLFVGVDWVRKGGELAVAAVREARKQIPGIRMVIVGCSPSLSGEQLEFCEVIGVLRKSAPAELERLTELYRQSHGFILPTRADCAPVVLAEAASYGLPAFSTDVGGVGTLVREGANGTLFPLDATPEDWGHEIARVFQQRKIYEKLSRGAYALSRTELNWGTAGARVSDILGQALKGNKC